MEVSYGTLVGADGATSAVRRIGTGRRQRVIASCEGDGHADRHALGNVVKRDGEDELGRSLEPRLGPFCLHVHVHVRGDHVEQEQKADSHHEPDRRGQEGEPAHVLAGLQGWLQEAPKRRRNHDAGGEAREQPLNRVRDLASQHEHHGSTETRAEEGQQNSLGNLGKRHGA